MKQPEFNNQLQQVTHYHHHKLNQHHQHHQDKQPNQHHKPDRVLQENLQQHNHSSNMYNKQ